MRLVIDSNELQTHKLRRFLERSDKNMAVVADFTAIEAYKGDPLKSVFKSMSVLSDFPSQVLVLKQSTLLVGLSGRAKGLQKRLVDETQTKLFTTYVKNLRLAEAGDVYLQNKIRDHGQYSNQHLSLMLNLVPEMRDAIGVLGKALTKEERRSLRSGDEYTTGLIDKIVSTVLDMVSMMFNESPFVSRRPSYDLVANTFVFRVVFATYLMLLRKYSAGGIEQVSPEKLRNDFVDMMFVAYGSYFDGVMSSDKNLVGVFRETCRLLFALFDAEIPSLRHYK